MKYVIEGGQKLIGEVEISGNKNSILPCMAAALLTDEWVYLENAPKISDVEVMLEIFKGLGLKTQRVGSVLKIKADKFSKTKLPKELVLKLRASILLVGPILARFGKVDFYYPGGDVIGRRSIQAHLDGFKLLGAKLKQNDLNFALKLPKNNSCGNVRIFLSERSVTATENIIMASVLGNGRVEIQNCATEPHVLDLCKMLISMGANISGVGSDTINIQQVGNLKGTTFRIGADFIEIGTYAIAAAITGGKITISNLDHTIIEPILNPLKSFGLILSYQDMKITVSAKKIQAIDKLVTNIWPGFPTDLMSAAIVLATQASGMTLCHDWMYESRMFFVDKLISMGAHITIADPHRVLVYGPTGLRGRELETPDIRAGMALVLAALFAKGTSVINRAELIERGYEDVVGKLQSLGAHIERVESE